MTGPRSSNTGSGRLVSVARNFFSALVAYGRPGRRGLGERQRFLRVAAPRTRASEQPCPGFPGRLARHQAACVLDAHLLGARIRQGRHAGRRLRRPGFGGSGLRRLGRLDVSLGRRPPRPPRFMSTLPRKCAPSAIATRGEMMSPSTEPLSRMSTFSRARDVADDFADDDHRLGEHRGANLAVRARSSARDRAVRSCPRRVLRSSDLRCRSTRP